MKYADWVTAIAVGGFLLFFGALKFTGAAHVFPYIEYRAGALGVPLSDLIFPWLNYAVGGLEIVAGALTLLPATRKPGSMIAVVPFAGAMAFHLSPLLGVNTPTGFAGENAAAATAAGGPFIREDFTPETSPVLFAIATVMLAASLLNVAIRRR